MSDARDALLFFDLDKGGEALGPLFEEPRQRLSREPALRAAWSQFQALRALALEAGPEPEERLIRQALAQCRQEAVKAQLARVAGSDDLAREILLGRVKERRGIPAWISLLLLIGGLGLSWMAFGPQIQALVGLGAGPRPEATPTPTFKSEGPDAALAFEFPEQTPPMEAALAAPSGGPTDDSDVKQEDPASRAARRLVREQLQAQARPSPLPTPTPKAVHAAPPPPTRPVPQVRLAADEAPAGVAALPTARPTRVPTAVPTAVPTPQPTAVPTEAPTALPSPVPTPQPTVAPKAAAPAKPLDAFSVSGPAPAQADLSVSAASVGAGKSVAILLSLPQRRDVDLRLFDQRGRPVRGILEGLQGPGTLTMQLSAVDAAAQALTPGTYYLRVMTPWFSRVEPIDVR